jgi:Ferritin-like domain
MRSRRRVLAGVRPSRRNTEERDAMKNGFTNDDRGNAPKVPSSRRSFLTRAAGVSALAVPTLTLITSRKAEAGNSKLLTGLNAELIQEIQSDEDQHVPIIQNLLDDPDNPLPVPIRQPPNLNMARLKQPNLQAFLETAAAFENTGSGLYHGALLNIQQTQEYFPTAAGLAAVEARHAAWLNSLLGQALVEDFAPVEAPISQSIVLTRVAEFVTDPRSTFPSFDTTVATDANGFFVLDFVLFLEYIESAFYDLNVPLFT